VRKTHEPRFPANARGLRALGLAIGLAALAGCASQPVRINSEWAKDAPRDQVYSRVLVVAVSPDPKQRCPFEGFLANQIRSQATAAIPSCRAMTTKKELTRENVEQAIAEHKADAVLVTTLVAMHLKGEQGGTSESRGDYYFKATGFGYAYDYWYGAYGVPVYYGEFRTAPPLTNIEGEVDILTRLYETKNATAVYQMETRAKDLVESRAAGLTEITGPIADRLRRDGLVR